MRIKNLCRSGSLSKNQFTQSARPHFAGESDTNLGHVARYAPQIRSVPPQTGDAHLGQSVFGQSPGAEQEDEDKLQNTRGEQPAGLSDRYTGDTESHLITYTSPETERIRSIDGTMADALTAGQTFRGTVYGSDEQIRRIVEYFQKHAITNLGTFAEEGFGEVCVKIDAVREQAPKATVLADTFDVCCLSDTLPIMP